LRLRPSGPNLDHLERIMASKPSPQRMALDELLANLPASFAFTIAQLHDLLPQATHVGWSTLQGFLAGAVQAGQLRRTARGRYALPGDLPPIPYLPHGSFRGRPNAEILAKLDAAERALESLTHEFRLLRERLQWAI
jgi:hypothetical protein